MASDGPGSAGHQQASVGATTTSTPANYGIPGSYSTNFHLPMPEEQVVKCNLGFGIDKKREDPLQSVFRIHDILV